MNKTKITITTISTLLVIALGYIGYTFGKEEFDKYLQTVRIQASINLQNQIYKRVKEQGAVRIGKYKLENGEIKTEDSIILMEK